MHKRIMLFLLVGGVVIIAAAWQSSTNTVRKSSAQSAKNSGSPSLAGTWQLIASKTVMPDGTIHNNPFQESFLLFTDKHYSMGWARGKEKSPYYVERFKPNDGEKLGRYNALLVNAGSYTISGSKIIIHPMFALVPEFVNGKGEFEYKIEGDTLHLKWVVIESADGVQDPWTAAGFRYEYTLKRIP